MLRFKRAQFARGWVAQLAEQWTENPRVGGSIPPPAMALFISKPSGKRAFWLQLTGFCVIAASGDFLDTPTQAARKSPQESF